jgi:predicted Fe-S protein YdhL (DUF1289 family)
MDASPCVGVCMIEFSTGFCAGCFRTLEEISRWTVLDEAGRKAVLLAVASRRKASSQANQKSAAEPITFPARKSASSAAE